MVEISGKLISIKDLKGLTTISLPEVKFLNLKVEDEILIKAKIKRINWDTEPCSVDIYAPMGFFKQEMRLGSECIVYHLPKPQSQFCECEKPDVNNRYQKGHCAFCGKLLLMEVPEELAYDRLDIARIDPEKREFVLAIQKAINAIRIKQDEILTYLRQKEEK